MATTPVFGFSYEAPEDLPGETLTGGPSGTHPILAQQIEDVLLNNSAFAQGVLTSLVADGNVPGQRVATAEITSESSTTDDGSDLEVASIDAPVVAGRIYRVTITAAVASDTSGDRCQIHIRPDDVSGFPIQNQNVYPQDTSSFGTAFYFEGEYNADVTETKTFVVTLELNNGTGPVRLEAGTSRPGYLYVDYIRSS